MKVLNPIKIIGVWVLNMIIVDIIVIPILFAKTVGGEQRPLTFLMESFNVTAYGIFILSILTGALYFRWLKKFWFISLMFFLLSGFYIAQDIRRKTETPYSFNEKTESIKGVEIKIKREYYSLNPEKIRSINYLKNEKKDSIWTTYSEEGNIIKQEKYKDDTLINRIK